MTDPATLIVYLELIARLTAILGELAPIATRIAAGENVSPEELELKKQETKLAIERWNAAGG